MASKRVMSAAVDWAELATRIPKHQKPDFQAFRAKSEGFLRKVLSNPEDPPKIDWSYYKANVANKALVEEFEKTYASLKIPYPSDKGACDQIEKEKKQLAEDIVVYVKNSNERIKKYQEELERFSKVPLAEDMSDEEFPTYYPQHAQSDLENPMIWPQVPACQESLDEIQFWQRRGLYYNKGDKYFPPPPPGES